MTRPSHVHWRVQTRTRDGWVTRAYPRSLLAGIHDANRRQARSTAAARVVLGDRIYYSTEAQEARA